MAELDTAIRHHIRDESYLADNLADEAKERANALRAVLDLCTKLETDVEHTRGFVVAHAVRYVIARELGVWIAE